MNSEPVPVPPRKFQLRRWQTLALEPGSFALDELMKKANSGELDMDDELSEHNGRWTQAGKQSKLFGLQADRYKFLNANKSLSLLTDKVRNNQLTSERYLHLRGQVFDAGSDLQAQAIVDDFISNLGGSANKTMIGTPETPATMVGDSHQFVTMTGDSLNPATMGGDLRPFGTMPGDSLNPATMVGNAARTLVGNAGFVNAVDLVPGDIVHDSRQPRYEVIDKLGEGGQGAVYKVKDLKLQGTVKAIKIQDPIQSCKEALKARFMSEGCAGNKLQHPNVVRVDDAKDDEVRGLVYLVMEFVDGGSLRDLINANPNGMEVQVVLSLIQSILDGLQAIHKYAYIHKDIKPENILIEKKGNLLVPKIADLGLAGIGDVTGAVGTFDYMAPEQHKGSAGITPSADLYALGKIFHELLAGQRPELGGELLGSLRSDAVRFKSVVYQSIKPKTEDRFQTCEEFAGAINRVRDGDKRLQEAIKLKRGDGVLQNLNGAFKEFEFLATSGDKPAMLEVADCYFKGLGCSIDREMGMEWLLKAANKGYANAMVELGWRYEKGDGCELDPEMASIWKRKAAENQGAVAKPLELAVEDPIEIYGDAMLFVKENGTITDNGKCRELMDKAAALHFPPALNFKGERQLEGLAPYSQDIKSAYECFGRSAKHGDAVGMYFLGRCFQKGLGTSLSNEKCFGWFNRSEKLGEIRSRYELAMCYRNGTGVAINLERSYKLFKQNAEEKHPASMREFAQCFLKGSGISSNPVEAIPWLRRASDAGDAEAMYLLAGCHKSGNGLLKKDRVAATEGFIRAADAGFSLAAYYAGEDYYFGNGVARDHEKSRKYLQDFISILPKNNLCPRAQYLLGLCFEKGSGGDVDMKKAIELYTESAKRKNPFAHEQLAYASLAGNGVQKDAEVAQRWAENARQLGLPDKEYQTLTLAIRHDKLKPQVTYPRLVGGSDSDVDETTAFNQNLFWDGSKFKIIIFLMGILIAVGWGLNLYKFPGVAYSSYGMAAILGALLVCVSIVQWKLKDTIFVVAISFFALAVVCLEYYAPQLMVGGLLWFAYILIGLVGTVIAFNGFSKNANGGSLFGLILMLTILYCSHLYFKLGPLSLSSLFPGETTTEIQPPSSVPSELPTSQMAISPPGEESLEVGQGGSIQGSQAIPMIPANELYLDSSLSGGILLSKNALPGTLQQDNGSLYSGVASRVKKDARAKGDVRSIFQAPGDNIAKLTVSFNDSHNIFNGLDLPGNANRVPVLVDTNENLYEPFGYIWVNTTAEEWEIFLEPPDQGFTVKRFSRCENNGFIDVLYRLPPGIEIALVILRDPNTPTAKAKIIGSSSLKIESTNPRKRQSGDRQVDKLEGSSGSEIVELWSNPKTGGIQPLVPQPKGSIPTASMIWKIEANGDIATIRQHDSVMIKGILAMPNGASCRVEIITQAPNKVFATIEVPEIGKYTEGINGDTGSGWAMNPIQGPNLDDPLLGFLIQPTLILNMYRNRDLSKVWTNAKTSRAVNFCAVPCYEIILNPNDSKEGALYYEILSGFLRGVKRKGCYTILSNYKEFDGVKIATSIVAISEKKQFFVDSADFGLVDPEIFNMPPEFRATFLETEDATFKDFQRRNQ